MIIEENDPRFYLDKSRLPHGGVGVFAKVFIRKGEALEVIGVMIEKGSECDFCTHYANSYKFAAAAKNATRHIIPLGFAAIVNHALDQKDQNMAMAYKPGPRQSEHASNLLLVATRDILPGEECLHYYGEEWNKQLRWSETAIQRLDDEEAEWDRFLSYKLYNLDFFDKFRGSDEPLRIVGSSLG